MGCDMHSFAEVRKDDKREKVGNVFKYEPYFRMPKDPDYIDSPFEWRSYGLFGFLGNVRNYSESESITDHRGIPKDASNDILIEYDKRYGDGHSASWVSLKELLDFDYDKKFRDRRIHRDGNGAARAEKEGEGEVISYKDFLGESYFKILEELKKLGEPQDVRIVFRFDN